MVFLTVSYKILILLSGYDALPTLNLDLLLLSRIFIVGVNDYMHVILA